MGGEGREGRGQTVQHHVKDFGFYDERVREPLPGLEQRRARCD